MLRVKLIILFLLILLVAKLWFPLNEKFTQNNAPCPSPNCSPCPSPNCSQHEEDNKEEDNKEEDNKEEDDKKETPSPGPSPKDNRIITGVEIIFNCDDCTIDSFTEEEKRDIISGILNKFTELNIENVEFKRGFVRVLIFLDLDDIDEDYVRYMVTEIKKNKIEMFVNRFKLETHDAKILYDHDKDYLINKKSGCHTGGRNNRNNINQLMKTLKEGGQRNVILQFRPCGPANIFAPHIEIDTGSKNNPTILYSPSY